MLKPNNYDIITELVSKAHTGYPVKKVWIRCKYCGKKFKYIKNLWGFSGKKEACDDCKHANRLKLMRKRRARKQEKSQPAHGVKLSEKVEIKR